MQAAVKYTAIGLAALATAGLGALPSYSSQALDQRLNDMASHSSPQSDVLLRNLQHHAGFWSSKGSVDVVMRDRCHDAEASADTTFHVEYEAQHLPTPGASNRFDWRLKPTGEAAPAFAKLFGSDAPLSGTGQITWGGLIRSDMKLPAMAYAPAANASRPTHRKAPSHWVVTHCSLTGSLSALSSVAPTAPWNSNKWASNWT